MFNLLVHEIWVDILVQYVFTYIDISNILSVLKSMILTLLLISLVITHYHTFKRSFFLTAKNLQSKE